MKRTILWAVVLTAVVSLYGCAVVVGGVVGGIGTATWLSGKLSQEVDGSYERAIDATKEALDSLGLKVEKETKKEDIAQVISEYGDLPVWIDIRPLSSSRSKIDIRVGATGNKEKSRLIMGEIEKRL